MTLTMCVGCLGCRRVEYAFEFQLKEEVHKYGFKSHDLYLVYSGLAFLSITFR